MKIKLTDSDVRNVDSARRDKIERFAHDSAGSFPKDIPARHEFNKKVADTARPMLKSAKRNLAKKINSKTDEGKNLRGKVGYMRHLDARARRRGEED